MLSSVGILLVIAAPPCTSPGLGSGPSRKDLWPPVALTAHDLRCQECSARHHLVLITHARLRAPQPGICVPSGWEIDLGSSEALAGGCGESTSEPKRGVGQGRRPCSGAMAPARMLWAGGHLTDSQVLKITSNSLPWQITRKMLPSLKPGL